MYFKYLGMTDMKQIIIVFKANDDKNKANKILTYLSSTRI